MKYFILIINFIFCQNILDRLIVPIYYQATLSTGYDSNILSYSKKEMENIVIGNTQIKDIKYYDSDYYKPGFKLIYSPVLLNQYETNLIIHIKNNFYRYFPLKNSLYFSGKFEMKFGSFHWLKIAYSFSPYNYLKRYQDIDDLSKDYFDCTYSNSIKLISYSVPLNNNLWTRINWQISDYFYNEHFTEFDTKQNEFNWFISHRFNSNLKLGANIGIGDGHNLSYSSGLISTENDRSYRTAKAKLSFSNYNMEYLNSEKFYISYALDYRKYLNESMEDPLHSGRIHYNHMIYSSLTKNINSNLKIIGYIKFSYRQTLSDYKWVEEIKSFERSEFGLNFIWNGVYDIYH